MQIYDIPTDDTLHALTKNGSPDFPFAVYFDEIDKYRTQCVNWHWHKEFQFSVVTDGPVDCDIGLDRVTLLSGQGLFINCGAIHRFSGKSGTLRDVLFDPEFLAPPDSAIFKKYVEPVASSGIKYQILRPENVPGIFMCLKTLYSDTDIDCSTQELFFHRVTCQLWEMFFPLVQTKLLKEESPANRLIQARMQLMLDFIHQNYVRPISLEDIAASAQISKSEAFRCFRKSIQNTPGNYLTEYRMNRSKELLVTTAETVTMISEHAGFQSAGYFCRVFKKRFGMTPESYRNARLSVHP